MQNRYVAVAKKKGSFMFETPFFVY